MKFFLKFFFSGFSLLRQETLDMWVFIYVVRLFSGYLKFGVLGTWMTFEKAEMAKTLRNGLSMIEMNSLNHNLSDFAI